jgi:hypothetical protein
VISAWARGAYLLIEASPPDGAIAVHLATPIHRQVVDAVEGKEVRCCRRPDGVWRHDVPVQLQRN